MIIAHSKPSIDDNEINSINGILESRMISDGVTVKKFEREIAQYYQQTEAVCCSSGTTALLLALAAMCIGENDEVIIPTYVCGAVETAIKAVGATPVFCDISSLWVMSPESITSKITSKTKAIVIVHTFGICVDVEPFKIFGVPLIEDCSQSFGATISNVQTGTVADVGIFSFHATKCLTAGGGGGLISKDKLLLARIRELQTTSLLGTTLSDIQASLGITQLQRYSEFLRKRREIATRYFEYLPKQYTNNLSKVKTKSIFFRFPLIIKTNFEALKNKAFENDISIRKGVDSLLHRDNSLADNSYTNAIEVYESTVSIPIYPSLSKIEQEKIITFFDNL